MILRSLSDPSLKAQASQQPKPAYEVFLSSQEKVAPPFLAIPQSSHAHLAGELAGILLPDVFGPIPPEVVEAIRQHDYGWITSDLGQAQSKRYDDIQSFPALSAEQAVPAWQATVRLAETVSPLIGILVNRHFCLLSDDDNPLHIEFRSDAEARRKPLEQKEGYAQEDLGRWTAAMGVCDLLSLYLCSGSKDPVEFPFCHPADRGARDRVSKTVLTWEGEAIRFTHPLFREGASASQRIPALTGERSETQLAWYF